MKKIKTFFLGLAAFSTLATLPMSAMAQNWQPKRPVDFTIMALRGVGGMRSRLMQ